MERSEKHHQLGKRIVEKLRDENFDDFQNSMELASSITYEEYMDQPKNPNLDPQYQAAADARFKFLNGLNPEQSRELDKLILNILDRTAFNFLREVEENLDENEGLGLTIQGEKVDDLSDELLSGTFFGEYLLWIDSYSKHGEFLP